jgi:hypothetical protein
MKPVSFIGVTYFLFLLKLTFEKVNLLSNVMQKTDINFCLIYSLIKNNFLTFLLQKNDFKLPSLTRRQNEYFTA